MFARMFFGGDLNGGLEKCYCAHGTTVHSGSTMVLGICYGCYERRFPDDGGAIILVWRQYFKGWNIKVN